MTHLYIELNTGLTEEVDIKVIEKLYDTVTNNTLDATSDLKGRLHSTMGYRYLVNHLNTTYSDLHISVDDYAIPFEDPNMLQYLLNLGIGSNGYITEAQAAAATTVANSENTTITKFNEFKYFTSITENKGGFSGTNTGRMRFYNWTALEEVDISNLTSIGHSNGNGWEDTFRNCSSLKKVIASDKLTLIGFNCFGNCSNLETITGLSGTIEVWDNAFYNCSKLPQSFFQPLSFLIKSCTDNLGLDFKGCTLLTSIDIADGTTFIPVRCFSGCSNLTTVTIPNSVTNIKNYAFTSCSSLTTLTIPTTVTSFGGYSFLGCTNLTTITGLSNVTTTGVGAFDGCSNLTSVDLTTSATFQANLFESCSNLTTIGSWVNNTVTISPTDNGNQFRTFYNCQKLEFPEELTVEFLPDTSRGRDMGASCFYNCKKLKKVILSGTNLNLSRNVFDASGLTLILGTENIKYIGNNIFYGTNISGTLNLCNCVGPGSRNSGYQTPDLNCLLGNVSGITKVILGDWDTTFNKTNWTFYGEYRSFFDNCSGLTTVDFKSMYDFPNIRHLDTNYIRSGFFHRCPNMTNFVIRQESVVPLQYTDDIVHPNDIGGPNVTLYVPASVVNDYKAAAGWSNISNLILDVKYYPGEWEFVDKTFTDYEYLGCGHTSVIISGTTTTIPVGCFQNSTNLLSVTLSSNVTSINSAAFEGCTSLENINLENITDLVPYGGISSNSGFYGCTNLFKNTGIVHMPNLTRITGLVFRGCSYIRMFIAENAENAVRSDYPFFETAIKAYIAPIMNKANDVNYVQLSGDTYHPNSLVGSDTLKVLELGKISEINKNAFNGYSGLTAIVLHLQDTVVTLNYYSSGDNFSSYFPNSNIKIYIPDSMITTYLADSVWSNFTSYIAPISDYDFSDHISDSDLVNYYNSVFNNSGN